MSRARRFRAPGTTQLFAFAWRNVRHLPDGLVRALAALAADVTWLSRTDGVRRLEANLARLRPDLDARALRRTSRAGMRSYLRYYAEVFQLAGWSEARVDARVRATGLDGVRTALEDGSVVLALGHAGNWDLAGAWAARHLTPVLTVAEKLPDGLYEEFVSFRNALGIEIVPLEGGATFRRLVRRSGAQTFLVPLLADRDLTAHGIEVDLRGHPARVAAGPAALALARSRPLFAVAIHYERLTGARRRAAGSPWGIVLNFLPVATTDDGGARLDVRTLTQAWVTVYFDAIAAFPQDWHMLQRVFLADLDLERLARAQDRERG